MSEEFSSPLSEHFEQRDDIFNRSERIERDSNLRRSLPLCGTGPSMEDVRRLHAELETAYDQMRKAAGELSERIQVFTKPPLD